MRVFVYEYICGGGLAGHALPESLAREGWAMLASIVEDFARVEGCEVTATVDERLVDRPLAAQRIERLAPRGERAAIQRLAAECDWTLVIAPEFDGILLDRVRWVEQAGGHLLGPSSAAVALTADKFACGKLLEQAGVPTVVGRIVRPGEKLPEPIAVPFPAVLKPRDGAGSQHTFLVPDGDSLSKVLNEALASGLRGEALLQPFVPGLPASVSLLLGRAGAVPLLPGEQVLSDDGRFSYLGGRIPLQPPLADRAVALARRAVEAVPGLRGYVGVDLVVGGIDALQIANRKSQIADSPDCVIEINPRLTTSYVGLRRLARTRLAERMLRCAAGEEIEAIEWHTEAISFSADGQVACSEANPGVHGHN